MKPIDATDYELRAGDLMTIEPVVVAVDAPIEEAQRLILDCQVSGLPVVDQQCALVGVVSQTDFMHLGDPDVRYLIHHKPSGIKVGEVMSRPELTQFFAEYLAGDLLLHWFGDVEPEGDGGFVLNTVDKVHVGDCVIAVEGKARPTGMAVRYQDA